MASAQTIIWILVLCRYILGTARKDNWLLWDRPCGLWAGGLKVYMAQFIKGQESGEHLAAQWLPDLSISQLGSGEFIINREPTREELALAQAGWSEISHVVQSGSYDVVILDEISHAVKVGLIGLQQVLELVSRRPQHVEIILTGRGHAG